MAPETGSTTVLHLIVDVVKELLLFLVMPSIWCFVFVSDVDDIYSVESALFILVGLVMKEATPT